MCRCVIFWLHYIISMKLCWSWLHSDQLWFLLCVAFSIIEDQSYGCELVRRLLLFCWFFLCWVEGCKTKVLLISSPWFLKKIVFWGLLSGGRGIRNGRWFRNLSLISKRVVRAVAASLAVSRSELHRSA